MVPCDFGRLYTLRWEGFDALGTFTAWSSQTAQRCVMLSEDAKTRLRASLDKVHAWPSVYMFKFIFEPEAERLESVLALFPPESEVLRRYSAGGKYLSLTVKEVMISADDVVARYDRAASIQGVITL